MKMIVAVCACIPAVMFLAGCENGHHPLDVAVALGQLEQPADVGPAPIPPTTQPVPQAAEVGPPSDAVATVNGQPIRREQLNTLLIEAYGKRMLQVLVALEVVRQEAKAKGLAVAPADVAAEEAASYPDELRNYSPEERERLLDEYLERNGLTRVHWRLTIERNAYLRKLSQTVPQPKEEEIQELFRRAYGEKIQVRHIQVESPAEMRKVQERLAKGEPFGQIARDVSTNKIAAANDGLLKPFDSSDPSVPDEIRRVAFALEKSDQVSGQILVRGHYHLLQLVKRIPPQTVKYEDVRAGLARQLHDQLVRVQMNYLLRSLPAAARIELLDPVIRQQAEKEQPETPEPVLPKKTGPQPPAPTLPR